MTEIALPERASRRCCFAPLEGAAARTRSGSRQAGDAVRWADGQASTAVLGTSRVALARGPRSAAGEARSRGLRHPQRDGSKARPATVIVGKSDVGVLYGVIPFPAADADAAAPGRARHRLAAAHEDPVAESLGQPRPHVERGYAGQSIWDWHKLPGWLDPRYTDYARANASIGINGTVLTNVNANATSLTPAYIAKAKALSCGAAAATASACISPRASARPSNSAASRPRIRWIPRCAPGGRPRSTRSTRPFRISAASW